jgi:hypothetical protein
MDSIEALRHLKNNETSLLAVHYSCESLGDGNEGLSPRITSIAVLHLNSWTMHSFSIHLIAERMGVGKEDITTQYDELEGLMLQDFNDFVHGRQESDWLHWNMSNINYGFEAISHRFQVLQKKKAALIPDTRRFNLSTLIEGVYGSNYVDHPKMQKLMELNGGRDRSFLTGQEESEAFKKQEYIKLHRSTMAKVYWFAKMYGKLQERKLVTTRTNFWNRLNSWLEKPYIKLLGFLSVIYAIVQFIQAAIAGFPLPK